jgi:predicted nucleic-acid-binding protein
VIAVDTNVLIRILVDDAGAEEQMKIARKLIADSGVVYVPQIVQVESVWVLESAYSFDKASVSKALEHLLQHPQFALQSQDCFSHALESFKNSSADFSDCLILAESTAQKARLATFDKKLGRLKGAVRLQRDSVAYPVKEKL